MTGRASAGGKAPLWQVEHCAATATCVWLKRLGRQAVVEWQLMQLVAPTGMCAAGLPVAELPLWQLAQLAVVGIWEPSFPVAALPLWQLAQLVAVVKPLWSGLDAAQEVVDLWHVSHTV